MILLDLFPLSYAPLLFMPLDFSFFLSLYLLLSLSFLSLPLFLSRSLSSLSTTFPSLRRLPTLLAFVLSNSNTLMCLGSAHTHAQPCQAFKKAYFGWLATVSILFIILYFIGLVVRLPWGVRVCARSQLKAASVKAGHCIV